MKSDFIDRMMMSREVEEAPTCYDMFYNYSLTFHSHKNVRMTSGTRKIHLVAISVLEYYNCDAWDYYNNITTELLRKYSNRNDVKWRELFKLDNVLHFVTTKKTREKRITANIHKDDPEWVKFCEDQGFTFIEGESDEQTYDRLTRWENENKK